VSQLDQIKEDRDVAEPFFNRLLQRAREKHPGAVITMDDIAIVVHVTVRTPGGSVDALKRVHRLLDDVVKESVGL